MRLLSDDGRTWACLDWPFPAGRVFDGAVGEADHVVKILDPADPRDPGEETRLRRLESTSLRVSPRVLARGTIPAGQHLEGHAFLVLSDEGRSLADWASNSSPDPLAPGAGQGLFERFDSLALDLLYAVKEACAAGVEPLQLAAEHVLVRQAGDRPVLCGWSGAWDPTGPFPDTGSNPWPEPLPVPERTAVYLWALLVGSTALGRPATTNSADGVPRRGFREADWDALGGGSSTEARAVLGQARTALLRRCLDVNPGMRPTLEQAATEWTRGPDADAPALADAGRDRRARVGRFVVDHPIVRYGSMAGAAIVGYQIAQAVVALLPIG